MAARFEGGDDEGLKDGDCFSNTDKTRGQAQHIGIIIDLYVNLERAGGDVGMLWHDRTSYAQSENRGAAA